MHRIEFFYDVVSPYSWLAFETLCRYRRRWNLDLEWRPFLLGGVMKSTGNTPPIMLPARAPHMVRDLARNARYFQVPLRVPSRFPLLTLRAMRLLTAVRAQAPDRLEAASRRLWQAYWAEDRDITSDDVLLGALGDAGLADTAAALLARADDPAVKDALRLATEEAVRRGAFGAPTFFVHTAAGVEMFFGSDRFPHLAQLLDQPWLGPLPDEGAAAHAAPASGPD